MKVTVTQEGIDKGAKCSIHTCPIALAVKSKRGIVNVSVMEFHASVRRNGNSVTSYVLPNKARKFVDDFDNNKPVEPFSFEMRKK